MHVSSMKLRLTMILSFFKKKWSPWAPVKLHKLQYYSSFNKFKTILFKWDYIGLIPILYLMVADNCLVFSLQLKNLRVSIPASVPKRLWANAKWAGKVTSKECCITHMFNKTDSSSNMLYLLITTFLEFTRQDKSWISWAMLDDWYFWYGVFSMTACSICIAPFVLT